MKNFGEILIEQGVITKEQLARALELQNRRLGEILIAENLADPVAVVNALKLQAEAGAHRRSSRVSLEASVLDSLLARLDALEDATTVAGGPGLRALPQLRELRASIEDVLLDSVSVLEKKAGWIASRAAAEAGKEVALTFEGADLMIDRPLIEDLSGIFMHLIRNAVDHGIETPDGRRAAGKPASGRVSITIEVSGPELAIRASDDGRGIEADKVYGRARELGLVEKPMEEIPTEDLLRLIFSPGFSTAEHGASSLSGRGVGLDVVEATLQRLGGSVTVASKPGQGAEFRLRVPLAYSKMSVLPLQVAGTWIAVRATHVLSVESVDPGVPVPSAAALFGRSVQESGSPPRLVVRPMGGDPLGFDDVAQPETALVRHSSNFTGGAGGGVIGTARLSERGPVLVADLALLKLP